MTVAAIVLSVPLIAEFLFAPVNLWTGRTIGNFVRFTGFDPRVGRTVFAPVKLLTAGLLTAGLAVSRLGLAGAASAVAISVLYLIRLAGPSRRDPAGILGFAVFGLLAAALLLMRIIGT